jgi:hypothetical protein
VSRALERGDVFFAFRPRVDHEDPASIDDVQRLYMILSPDELPTWRRLVIGKKRLPDASTHERSWAFVDRVGRRASEIERELEGSTYSTRTRGERHQPPARPVGEGRYAIVEHGDHAHLAYALELPRSAGAPQRALRIAPTGSYIVSVANPKKPVPPGMVVTSGRVVEYPEALDAKFRGRRFAELEPAFLDHEGCEIVLIGVRGDAEHDLGIELDVADESAESAQIFRELGMKRDEAHPVSPLLEGAWE